MLDQELFNEIERRFKAITGERGRVIEIFQRQVWGVWLAELVGRVAAERRKQSWEAFTLGDLSLTGVQTRFRKLAQVFERETSHVSDVEESAHTELRQRIRRGHIEGIALHVLLRARGDDARFLKGYVPLDSDPEDIRGEFGPPPIAAANSQEEIDECTRIMYGRDSTCPVHHLVAMAWADQRKPEAIVEDLGGFRPDELGKLWIACFAARHNRPPGEVEVLFGGMLSGSGTQTARAPRRRLSAYANPAATVSGWIKKVDEWNVPQNGGPENRPALHCRVAWLYKKMRNYPVDRIVAELGPQRRGILMADLRQTSAIAQPYPPLMQDGNCSSSPLGEEYKPGKKVAHWEWNVKRVAAKARNRQLFDALTLIAAGGVPPWEIIAFLWTRCGRRTPDYIADRYPDKPIGDLGVPMLGDIATHWWENENKGRRGNSLPARADAVRLKKSLADLWHKLLPLGPNATLNNHSTDAGLIEDLDRWSKSCHDAVKASFAQNTTVRLFSIRYGLPYPSLEDMASQPLRSEGTTA